MNKSATKPKIDSTEMQFDSAIGSESTINQSGSNGETATETKPKSANEKRTDTPRYERSLAGSSTETAPKSAKDKKTDKVKPQKAVAPAASGIHASECVLNSECTLTVGCRGRLKATNPIGGKIQIYCPKCHQFAEGTRPANGMVSASGKPTFDRTRGKTTEDD